MEKIKLVYKKLPFIWLILAFIGILAIVFLGTRALFHADDATAVLFAREQLLQKKFLPDDWNNGTSIWTIGLQTFVLPFLMFLNDWILCRELAVCVQTILFVICFWFLMREIGIKEKVYLLILSIVPVSEEILEHCFFQATYMTLQLFEYFVVAITISALAKYKVKNKYSYIYLFGIIFSIVISCHSTLVTVATSVLPILGAIIIYYALEYIFSNENIKLTINEFIIIGAIIIGIIFALIIYYYLQNNYGFSLEDANVSEFIGKTGYANMINSVFDEFLLLYGAVGEGSLFTLQGITRGVRLAYFLTSAIIVPTILLVNYKRIKSKNQKTFIIYSVLTFFILIFIAVITGKCSSRYFIPVYFNNILLLGILADSMLKDKLLTYIYKFCIAFLSLMCFGLYIMYNYTENPNDIGMWRSNSWTADTELIELLEEKEVGLIYAPYWTAYSNMVASNGIVQGVAYIGGDPMNFKEWLDSSRWAELDYYDGRTAVIFNVAYDLNDVYLELASESLQYKGWQILVFDRNLLSYDEIAKIREEIIRNKNEIRFSYSASQLTRAGSTVLEREIVKLKKNGQLKGPGVSIKAGEYTVKFEGSNLKSANVCVYYYANGGLNFIDIDNLEKHDEHIIYEFKVDKDLSGIEFFIKNEYDNDVCVKSLVIDKN